jgi:ATP-dependent RNA helicase DDX31/DBP7
LPILQKLAFTPDGATKKQSRKDLGTKCIILCPTRELASQTLVVLEKLCQANFAGWMVPGGLSGGDSRNSEKSRIRKGLAIVVATPGRLLDHLHKTESLLMNLKGKLQWLVLDEADRLLDMGLGDQVKQIVQLIRANEACKSQPWWRSVLVSATVTPSVQALAKERFLCGDQPWVWVKRDKDDTTGDASKADSSSKVEGFSQSTPRQLAQFQLTVTAKLRLSTLVAFLIQRVMKGERTVVFMGTCASVDYHHQLFASLEPLWDTKSDTDDNGLFGDRAQVFKLHGSVEHSKRNQTLKQFDAASDSAILLTTDVAARGLNLPGVDWTVQYDPPCEISDYVHRVGRVARAGKAGHSLLFLLPSERGYLEVLQTKGISTLSALSLANTLNEAASLCPDWTTEGATHGGANNQKSELKKFRSGEYFSAEVQRRMEDCVVQDDVDTQKKWKEEKSSKKRRKEKKKEGLLLELARDAFLSFLRAYGTKKEASVRSIFSARALHVGHVARSFALKEPPKSLVARHKQNKQEDARVQDDVIANKPKALGFNQYENNLVSYNSDDGEDEQQGDARPSKRGKFSGKPKNAKSRLFDNARKMQSNLMDAM